MLYLIQIRRHTCIRSFPPAVLCSAAGPMAWLFREWIGGICLHWANDESRVCSRLVEIGTESSVLSFDLSFFWCIKTYYWCFWPVVIVCLLSIVYFYYVAWIETRAVHSATFLKSSSIIKVVCTCTTCLRAQSHKHYSGFIHNLAYPKEMCFTCTMKHYGNFII